MLDFDAGPYAAFIWPAYGLTVIAFIGMIAWVLHRARKWRRRAEGKDPLR